MLRYTSTLKPEYHEDLERLMFFNPGQHSVLPAIVDSLEQFGSPSVYTDNGYLRIKLEKLEGVQTLFALYEDTLIGLVVYSRTTLTCLTVIHIAVDHDYSSNGKFAHVMLVMRMLGLLRKSARLIKGVETVRIICNGNQIKDCPV
jgi:hypothetical protein